MAHYRVAVVVFCEVENDIDQRDAEHVCRISVQKALNLADGPLPQVVLKRQDGDLTLAPVDVHAVEELGMATRNGRLWVGPTESAYR